MKSFRSVIFQFFVLGQAVFVVGVTVLIYLAGGRLIEEFVVTDSVKVLKLLKHQIESSLLKDLSRIDQLAEISFFRNMNEGLVKSELKEFLSRDNPFTSIHLYDVGGKLVLHERRNNIQDYKPETSIFEIENEQIKQKFQSVKYNLEPELSPMVATRNGFNYQVYFVPILDRRGYLRYVLSGAIAPTVRQLDFLFKDLTIEDQDFVALYSQGAGLIAGRWNEDDKTFVGKLQTKALSDGYLPAVTEDKHIVVFEKMPRTNYVLALGISKLAIAKKQNRLLKFLIPLSSLSLAFAVVLSWILGRRFLDPTSRLLEALKRIHSGQFGHRTDYSKDDDFGYMCHLVDHLAAKMEKEQMLGEFWTNETEIDKIKHEEKLNKETLD